MKPGPSNAKKLLADIIGIDSSPKSAIDWLVTISLAEGWYSNPNEAVEAAEKWEKPFLSLILQELNEFNQVGRFTSYAINSSSDDLIQGAAFVEPKDPPNVRASKSKRALQGSYTNALRLLIPREFEALCAGIVELLGVEKATLTDYSADEGIDFYGKLHLEKMVSPNPIFPSIQRQLNAWIIGQAKHYIKGQVSTFEIRDLVGAVELAKGKAFGAASDKYADLAIKVCDPVFYLFITTGSITANSWRLLSQSGVAGMDGDMVASFLADNQVGLSNGVFDNDLLKKWVAKFI